MVNLDLSKNNITSISFIENFKSLKKLNLYRNQVSDISPLKNLKSLRNLKLQNNPFKKLQAWIINFNLTIKWEKRSPKNIYNAIYLYDNPIISPPIEIVKQGKQAIKDWFNSPKTENNEIKLIITGNTTTGKTTLVNFLTKEKYSDTNNSTHGIQINKWKLPLNPLKGEENKVLNVNIWDFGGQEYYHATHRLFLTSNSVYLLLWEKSKNKTDLFPTEIMISGKEKPEIQDLQHYKYEYWLDLTRKFAKESPIFIIQNKIDDLKNGNQEEPTDNKAIQKYAVKKDYHISVKEAFNQKDNTNNEYNLQFRIFKNNLIKTLQETAKGREIQVYIANVREKIREHAEENIWNWQQYKDFCYKEAKAEMTDERMKILTQYLHDTGVILYYGYIIRLIAPSGLTDFADSKLKNTVFISPSYVTETIYNILDYKVQDNKGKFTKQDVTYKLQDKEKAETFIALMQSPNFELIFEYPDEPDTYYATQYLPDNIEDKEGFFTEIIENFETAFVLKFKSFFSMSIMTRFIARYGFYSEKKWFSKQEILLKRDGIRVFVECKFKEQKIFVKTAQANKTHFLIKEIFNTFMQLSDNDQTVELSLDNKIFDSLELVYQRPEKYPEYIFLTL
ncbi:MAG: COR domain-containing protein, partial [Bacteroidota bacterium]|nr:COR domain-containing protein [Bacteroidota bacterium]